MSNKLAFSYPASYVEELRARLQVMQAEIERLRAVIKDALENGCEGMWSNSWDQDNATSGFWISCEDYERLQAIHRQG